MVKVKNPITGEELNARGKTYFTVMDEAGNTVKYLIADYLVEKEEAKKEGLKTKEEIEEVEEVVEKEVMEEKPKPKPKKKVKAKKKKVKEISEMVKEKPKENDILDFHLPLLP